MISKFFIDRPIFASVLSIVITLAGFLAAFQLPIAMFPQIAPPTINIQCNYPGASAQVVAETVAVPIEQQVNGVENMMYMSSQCTNDGSYSLAVTFRHGMDLNMAQVLVQNRVSLALPQLPDVLKQTGVDVRKQSPDILLALAINSPTNRYNQLYLSNFVVMQIKDEIARMSGVSEVRVLGQRDYSMRIWVDPEKLAYRNMSAVDVVQAIREQNLQVSAGQLGQPPMSQGQLFQVPLSSLGRLSDVKQFGEIILRAAPGGGMVRLKDVARVELGAKNSDITCKVNGKDSVTLAVFQLPDANALDVAVAIKARIAEMKKEFFPEGMDWEIRYDTTPFISESIGEVFKTLREAILLVAVVVLLFLQNWRSALIPLVAVPVAIVGTFTALLAFGFSLNNLTLFGLVLAIGIVVDDAIVVVEAVEHHIEHGMAPRDATIRAMEDVSGPVVAIGLVLTAVFVPCAFISGIVGQFFRQFALTIAVSTVISAFNSLTLSPALAALLLRPRRVGERGGALPKPVFAVIGAYLAYALLSPWLLEFARHYSATHPGLLALSKSLAWVDARPWWAMPASLGALGFVAGWIVGGPLDRLLTGFFHLFNLGFKKATWAYGKVVGGFLRVSVVVLIVYGGLLYLTSYEFANTPKGFIPSQDMGYLLINVQLPDSAADERTREVLNKIERMAKATEGIRHTQTIAGQSLLLSANGSNFGSMFVILAPFEERRSATLYGEAIQQTLRRYFTTGMDEPTLKKLRATGKYTEQQLAEFRLGVPEAVLTVLGPPPVRGVGRAGGFKFMVEDREDVSASNQQILDADDAIEKAKSQGKSSAAAEKARTLPKKRTPNILQFQAENLAAKARTILVTGESLDDHNYADEIRAATNRADKEKADGPLIDAEAASLAENVLKQGGASTDGRINILARLWLTRPFRPEESDLVRESIEDLARYYKAHPTEAARVRFPSPAAPKPGPEKKAAEKKPPAAPPTADSVTMASWSVLCKELKREPLLGTGLVSLVSIFRANVPQIFVDVNRVEASRKKVSLRELFSSMQIYLGSLYVNDFNLFGRTWQVIVQAEPRYRNRWEDVKFLKVRNQDGSMVPIGSLVSLKEKPGPLVLMRYNLRPAAPIQGAAAPGVSTGQAIKFMEKAADENLISAMSYEWTELAYLEQQAGNTAMYVFAFAVVMVFLLLAALYESWSMPLAIILVVPMCLLSAVVGINIGKQDVNIFSQIGFVVLVGLASKNAILIVEFAKQRRDEGVTARQAALDACVLRLRPIIMTSLAFILGVVPLIVGHGAGAEMRRTLGITVFSGMLGVTLFGIVLTPIFFYVINRLGDSRVFQSPLVRQISRITLGIMHLRPVTELGRYAIREIGRRTRPANGNGNGDGNGNGNGSPEKPAADSTELPEFVDKN